eukprot:CAMPEP_0113504704 /NCGR_PEP_ID=MMETSP0014_2-20120614/34868_1 /TAXON_ID=2857 /ORGANISM="Nitzschia sp." /LENGTH=448 /DNA_ID=CAMNT_0000399853 /DNA_START=96 /DNA_END=1439 /DNA_ORIENTATION=- /assembly_acc=CAM_ASM_000159
MRITDSSNDNDDDDDKSSHNEEETYGRTTRGRRRSSDRGYDNCKTVFMFYVVLFHMANNYFLYDCTNGWTSTSTTLMARHLFHRYTLWHEKLAVPGFAFLSGFFGKKFGYTMDGIMMQSSSSSSSPSPSSSSSSSERWKRSFTTLFVGSLNVQLVEVVMRYILTMIWFGRERSEASDYINTVPTFINFYDHLETWYLLALLCWRIATPFIIQLTDRPLLASLVLAFVHVHIDWGNGSADLRMRIFRFFPFYVAGLVTDKSTLDRVRRPVTSGVLGIALSMIFAVAVEDPNHFLGIYYAIPSWSIWDHTVLLFQYVYAGIIVVSVILIVKEIKVSSLLPWSHSNSTLAIYVWHWQLLTLIVYGNVPFGVNLSLTNGKWPVMEYMKSVGRTHPVLAIVSLHVLSYAICVVLGSQLFWKIIRPITDPDISFVFRKRNSSLTPLPVPGKRRT